MMGVRLHEGSLTVPAGIACGSTIGSDAATAAGAAMAATSAAVHIR
jgi:hypothetical protein